MVSNVSKESARVMEHFEIAPEDVEIKRDVARFGVSALAELLDNAHKIMKSGRRESGSRRVCSRWEVRDDGTRRRERDDSIWIE